MELLKPAGKKQSLSLRILRRYEGGWGLPVLLRVGLWGNKVNRKEGRVNGREGEEEKKGREREREGRKEEERKDEEDQS